MDQTPFCVLYDLHNIKIQCQLLQYLTILEFENVIDENVRTPCWFILRFCKWEEEEEEEEKQKKNQPTSIQEVSKTIKKKSNNEGGFENPNTQKRQTKIKVKLNIIFNLFYNYSI